MEKDQIVYYMGAGASAHAIPVLDGMRPRFNDVRVFLEKFRNLLETERKSLIGDPNIYQNCIECIIDDLKWLSVETEFHQTVDTLAKKYYLINNENFNRLKRALVAYFYFEQFARIPSIPTTDYPERKNFPDLLDKRYDNLIASISRNGKERKIELKDNIKIITWNYDIQIDKAIIRYVQDPIEWVKKGYQIFPNIQGPSSFPQEKFDINKFAVFKLNGNAYLNRLERMEGFFDPYSNNELLPNLPETGELEIPFINKFLYWFNGYFSDGRTIRNRAISTFCFAWEKKSVEKDYKNFLFNVKEVLNRCRVLIVVGYSFPYFNSDIDRQLLSDIWPDEVIIQDFNFEEVQERMLELNPNLIQKSAGYPVRREIKRSTPGNFFPIHHST